MISHGQGKQRVLLIARSLHMGGVERNTVNLANTFAAQGHDVHILVLKDRIAITPDLAVNVHVVDFDKVNRLTGIGLLYDLLTRAILAPLMPGSGFLWRGLYGGFYFRLWLRRLERRVGHVDKIIVRGQGGFENLWSFSDPRFYQVIVSPQIRLKWRFLEKLYARLLYAGKRLVVNSSGTQSSLNELLEQHGVKPDSITLIPNPIPVKRIQALAEQYAPIPQEPYLVHVARLTYQKNQPLLLKAYKAANVSEKLVIVGSGGDEGALRRLAEELGIADRVIFAGLQTNPYPWMKGARLFVLSSVYEGFGLVMAESMVCGTPVVAVDCPGGVRDVLIEEQAQFIAELTIEGLAAKIREALANPIEVKPQWYLRFDAEKIADSFLALPASS